MGRLEPKFNYGLKTDPYADRPYKPHENLTDRYHDEYSMNRYHTNERTYKPEVNLTDEIDHQDSPEDDGSDHDEPVHTDQRLPSKGYLVDYGSGADHQDDDDHSNGYGYRQESRYSNSRPSDGYLADYGSASHDYRKPSYHAYESEESDDEDEDEDVNELASTIH